MTLNDATVLGGAGDYEGLITVGANDSLFAGDPVGFAWTCAIPCCSRREVRWCGKPTSVRNVGMPTPTR
ncbi:MAG: hypothetical protein ACLSVD_04090 [Eggerthellaceae bacterium]